jgi:DnaJ-class molecular chaperone
LLSIISCSCHRAKSEAAQVQFGYSSTAADFDPYHVLAIPADAVADRIRAAFHRLSVKFYNRNENRFSQVALAYSILKNDEFREVLDKNGIEGLRRSESLSETSVFDVDPYEVYDSFFDGSDEEVRQYLLLHGPNALSDEDEDENEGQRTINTEETNETDEMYNCEEALLDQDEKDEEDEEDDSDAEISPVIPDIRKKTKSIEVPLHMCTSVYLSSCVFSLV